MIPEYDRKICRICRDKQACKSGGVKHCQRFDEPIESTESRAPSGQAEFALLTDKCECLKKTLLVVQTGILLMDQSGVFSNNLLDQKIVDGLKSKIAKALGS